MRRYLSPTLKFYFPFLILHQLFQTYFSPMDLNFKCEKLDVSFYLDHASTEAQSSDGSQQSFIIAPSYNKYKTQPCKNYSLLGYCNYGEKCQFAHGNNQLNPVLSGNLYKTKECKNFWKKGYCLYGIRCQFLHSEGQKRPSHYNSKEYMKKKKSSYLDFITESRLLKIL